MPARSPALEQMDKRLLELTALFEISRSLTASFNLNAILENILRIPMGYMLISRGMVLLKKGSGQTFTVEDIKGFPRQLLGKIIEVDSPPIHATSVRDIEEDQGWNSFLKGFEIELIVPLVSSRGVIGIIGFGKKISGESYDETEVEFLDSLSNIAATMVVNGMMVDEIQTVNRQLDRKIQQLSTIFDISRELNTTLDCQKIGSLLSFTVMGELLVNKCIVFTRVDNEMHVLVAKGLEPVETAGEDMTGLSAPLFLADSNRFQKVQEQGISLFVPMRMQDETRGILAVGSKISGDDFLESELDFLTTLGNQAVTSLENARLFEEMLEKQRMEEELSIARNIQQTMFPTRLPEFEQIDIAAVNIPSREVGGDYYDIIVLDESRFGVTIADVAGKGAGAAMLMSNLQASLHALLSTDLPIHEVLLRINKQIVKNTGLDKFITFFYGELDTEKKVFTYCNAGHNPPVLLHSDGKVEELTVGGIVIGMMEEAVYETASVQLEAGDAILMYTDGITEAMNSREEEYGEDKMLECFRANQSMPCSEIIQKIVKSVKSFSRVRIQSDDMTMVVIKMLQQP